MLQVSCFMTDRMGAFHPHVTDDLIDRLLGELDGPVDVEHPDVSIEDESGWGLSALQSGLVVWENVEGAAPAPRHMKGVPRTKASQLFRRLAAGDLVAVEDEPWEPGYF